ncbi:MAG: ferritin-like domain-containing protein [Firmicutes bacterium]|nr:ferritin-like domain-containing protein [Bacillota bacterium]
MAKLTSKELGLIEDSLRQEQLMIQKFGFYANQATDPEIKSLCQNLRDMHQRHLDTLMRHLNEAATL